MTIAPSSDGIYTYTLTCASSTGAVTDSVTLGVTPAAGKITHVVIIVQENRTPDNLFHGLPGADIANSGVNSQGQIIPLQPIALATDYDLSHVHASFVSMYDGGRMDGADKVPVYCSSSATMACPPPNPQFMYVNPTDVAPYFQLAKQYAFADRMFQTNQGPSFPAHQFLIAGTSAPSADSPYFAAENTAPLSEGAGCSAPPDVTVALIDPLGNESTSQYPCFEHQTLPDLLDHAGIDWRYYSPNALSIWAAPNAIEHLNNGPDWQKVILPETNVLTDIATGNLAPVTWITPDGTASDHPSINNGSGPSWVASIVNAIGASPYWNSTAIFVTWDDWGGWYDHVAPTIVNSYEYGFRVPLIVVSPYAKSAYVSHTTHDFGSILKFIEENYGLPSLGYADAPADDLIDCFYFSKAPAAHHSIPTQFDSHYFIERSVTTPPTDPDTD